MTVRGATSVAGTMRRLDRLGHLPAGLGGAGSLDGLTADPLGGLAGEGVVGAALESVLAQLETAPDTGTAAADARVSRSVSRRADAPVASASAPASAPGVPAPAVAVRQHGRASRGPAPVVAARVEATPSGGFAPPGVDVSVRALDGDRPPRGAASGAAAASIVLSPPARLGASTPVALPLAGAVRIEEPRAIASVAGVESPAAASPSGRPADRTPAAQLPRLPAVAPASAAAPGTQPPTEPEWMPTALAATEPPAAGAQPGRTSDAPAAPVEGLSGLVSWWDSRTAAAADSPVGGVAPAPGRSAAWTVDQPGHEAARAAEGAFEGMPVVRLSLRTALEELLLAEARASGIEVEP